MTTDPHIYPGEFCDLHIRPSDAPESVEVEVFSQKRKNGLWVEVPVAKVRSMLAASVPPGSYARTDEEGWQARAEKAERERDEWKDSAIKAMADLERAEQPRPLIPDDAMVLRALNTVMWEEHKVGPWGSLDSFRTPAVDAMRTVLTAALTVPKRPEGAEEMEALIGSWERSELLGQNLTADDLNSLADHLAERGVRVITEDGAA